MSRIGCIAALSVVACVGPHEDEPKEADRCHESALAIAHWLEAAAVRTEHGIQWPIVPGAEPPQFSPSLYSGSCGPVLFFVELAARTGRSEEKEHWLGLARAGADELLASLPPTGATAGDDGGDGEESSGLYTGLAGIGFTLFTVGKATGDERWLDGARTCVDRLHERARLAGSGIEWSATTDVIAGSAGIGFFLLFMKEQTGDDLALELATRAGRRLLDLSQREAVGRSWRMDPTFARVMPNFSHGTAGIACFLARLFGATGEEEFLDAARDGADHLLAIADRSNGGCRIHHHTPDGTDLYYLGWCHGPCGTSRLFLELGRATGERRWFDAVVACARSVTTSGLEKERLPGFWNNVGICCGSAGVVDFLLEYARVSGDCRDLPFARAVAADLLARGMRDESGLRFRHAEHRTRPELLAAQTGYMQGASGIGIALLRLEAFERGVAPSFELPDSPLSSRQSSTARRWQPANPRR